MPPNVSGHWVSPFSALVSSPPKSVLQYKSGCNTCLTGLQGLTHKELEAEQQAALTMGAQERAVVSQAPGMREAHTLAFGWFPS